MAANPSAPAPGAKPQTSATPALPTEAYDAKPTAPAPGRAATDTLADAADEKGTVKATRRMPEPDSLGG